MHPHFVTLISVPDRRDPLCSARCSRFQVQQLISKNMASFKKGAGRFYESDEDDGPNDNGADQDDLSFREATGALG